MQFSQINQAVILAGGRGERLRPLTDRIPKPMAPVNGIPFLDYLLQSLVQIGIKRVLLLVGYLGEVIVDRYSKLSCLSLQIEFSVGAVDDRTGHRLLNAYNLLENHFLLLYGDNYWPIEFDRMVNLYRHKRVFVSTTVFSNLRGTGEYGKENNIEVSADGFVKRYDKNRKSDRLNGVDIGYFIVDKEILNENVEGNLSFEENVLPELIARKQLMAFVTDTQYYYVTDLDSLKNFERAVMGNKIKPISVRT